MYLDIRKSFANLSLIVWVAFGCCLGCGDAPNASVNQPSSPTPAANSTDKADLNAATEQPTEPGKVEQVNAPTPVAQTAKAEPQNIADPKSETPTTNGPGAVAPQPPALKVPVSEVPAPTATQLTRWKQPDFEPLQLLARHQSEQLSFVSHAVSSPDGEWLALGGEKLTLWKPLADKPLATLWDLKASEKSESVKSLAIDPTGNWIAAGDADGTLRLWNLSDQKELITKKVQNNDIVHIAISDDANEIATVAYGKEVSVWDSKTLAEKKKFEVTDNGREGLLYAGPGKLAVASQSLTIWDTATGTLAKTLVENGYAASLTRSADRSLFLFAEESRLQILKSSDLSASAELSGNFARNEILKLTTDGKFLWTANGSSIRGWDLATGQAVQTIDVNKPEVVALDWLESLKLLRVITDDGAIRYWGTPASGNAAGLKPLHAAIEIPEGHSVPTSAFELQSMIDLRMLPKPPDSISTPGEMTMVQIDSGNSMDDTKAFYRYVFSERGWKELPGNVATPDYLTFIKNGYRVFLIISDSGTGRISIYMTSLGNVDLRTLPKSELPGFKVSYEDASNMNYEVAADLLTIETDLLKKFSASGWLPYVRLNASHSEEPDRRSLEFIRNAMTIRVSIQPKPTEPAKYHVQYSAFVALNHLPVPDDCDFIECDAARAPALVVKTSLSLEDCHAFYDKAMSKLGWLPSGVSKSKEGDLRWLTYFRDQSEVRIRLTQDKEGGTWIVVGEYAQQNSWQLAKKEEPKQESAEPNTSGIQAADIPIFKQAEATSVNFDKQQQSIEIKLPKNSHVEIVDFYAAKLAALGWKEEPNGFREEDYAFVTFTKDDVSVQVRVNSNSLGTTIGISDDGLLWDKAPTESKRLISYESWIRKNGRLASLKHLDEYVQEMRQISK